jgi:hypothetical protein
MNAETHEAYRAFFEARMLNGESVTDIRAALEALCVPFEDRCAFCPNPATRYCDFIFGWEKKGTATVPSQIVKPGEGGYTKRGTPICGTTIPYEYDYLDFDSEAFTCDLNICDSCATQGAPMFACHVTPIGPSDKSEVIIRDFCPEHRGQGEPLRVITPDQARVERNQNALRVLSRHPLVMKQELVSSI